MSIGVVRRISKGVSIVISCAFHLPFHDRNARETSSFEYLERLGVSMLTTEVR